MEPDTVLDLVHAPRRNSRHWTASAVTWGEVLGWVNEPAAQKEAGNYLFGELKKTTVAHDPDRPDKVCTALHRRKGAVVSRCALTLDLDHPGPGFA